MCNSTVLYDMAESIIRSQERRRGEMQSCIKAENSFGKNCNQCIFGGTKLQANCHLLPNNARAGNFIKKSVGIHKTEQIRVIQSNITDYLKIPQKCLEFSILAFSANFCPIEIDLSGSVFKDNFYF